MIWAVGVLTAPRERPTLPRTLKSLAAAGWPAAEVLIHQDPHSSGSWPNWYAMIRRLLSIDRRADVLLLVEDDAVVCRDLRPYVEQTLWPADDCAYCSPYAPTPYNEHPDVPLGWHEEARGFYAVGSICLAMPRPAAEVLVRDLAYQVRAVKQIDARVGMWAADTGRSCWYHKPSLAQHVGIGNTAFLSRRHKPDTDHALRRAGDFVGEDATPAG